MRTATVRQLRNNYTQVLEWVSSGQEVQVTRRGKIVARVIPPDETSPKVDWSLSAAFNRPNLSQTLTAKESAAILADSQGA